MIDRFVRVSDRDSFLTARRLTREEGILVGGSSGTALFAALEVAKDLDENALVLVLFADSGRNYLSKIFNDEWMRQNGFPVALSPPTFGAARRAGAGPPKSSAAASPKPSRRAMNTCRPSGISKYPG